jgi:hypothetical protein
MIAGRVCDPGRGAGCRCQFELAKAGTEGHISARHLWQIRSQTPLILRKHPDLDSTAFDLEHQTLVESCR